MKRNIWPYAIIAYFVIFITGMVSWVVFAMRHDDQLVRPDYYEHEINYQKQIDRIFRTGVSAPSAEISYDARNQQISFKLPDEVLGAELHGSIHLYRPADARLDQRIPLQLRTDGSQQVDVSKLQGGYWKVLVSWKMAGQEFYLEKPVVILGNF